MRVVRVCAARRAAAAAAKTTTTTTPAVAEPRCRDPAWPGRGHPYRAAGRPAPPRCGGSSVFGELNLLFYFGNRSRLCPAPGWGGGDTGEEERGGRNRGPGRARIAPVTARGLTGGAPRSRRFPRPQGKHRPAPPGGRGCAPARDAFKRAMPRMRAPPHSLQGDPRAESAQRHGAGERVPCP